MATATIISNLGNLAWQGLADSNLTEDEDTTVTNSSGADVWWGTSETQTRLKKNKSYKFTQKTATIVYNFADTEGGAAQITLTMTGTPPGGTGKKKEPLPAPKTTEPRTTEVSSSDSGVIDEIEVEVKIKIKLKDGKVISIES